MHTIEGVEPRLLAETDFLGTAYSRVPLGYEGACRVRLSGSSESAVVLPTVSDAEATAKAAIGELGGYWRAVVEPAAGATPTHSSWSNWLFG